jgi:hypothetical protein
MASGWPLRYNNDRQLLNHYKDREERMAKMTGRKNKKEEQREKQSTKASNEPWLSQRTGRIIMIIGSLALVAYMTYQLEPPLGLAEALLWGLGFGLAMWTVFIIAYFFNKWLRRG